MEPVNLSDKELRLRAIALLEAALDPRANRQDDFASLLGDVVLSTAGLMDIVIGLVNISSSALQIAQPDKSAVQHALDQCRQNTIALPD